MPELDLGNVKGPQGKSAYQSALDAGYSGSEEAFNTAMAKAPNAVLYTAQSLTDAQKAQARGNINAAPGGFGWGDSLRNVLASDTEDTYETYCGKLDALLADMPDGTSQLIYTRGPASTGQYSGAGNIVAVLSKLLGTSASLIGISPEPRGTTNGLWRMLKDNGVWRPVEWSNPPMELGVEYRTTERYLGKPVYVKLVDCGKFPPPGNSVLVAHSISNCYPVSITARMSNGNTVPFVSKYTIGADGVNIFLESKSGVSDQSANTTVALMRYTKTTD